MSLRQQHGCRWTKRRGMIDRDRRTRLRDPGRRRLLNGGTAKIWNDHMRGLSHMRRNYVWHGWVVGNSLGRGE